MIVKPLTAFSKKKELPYSANRIDDQITKPVKPIGNIKEFTFNNFLESKIKLYDGFYMSKGGEPCTIFEYQDKMYSATYEAIVPYSSITSFQDAIVILREIDPEKF